LKDSATLGKVTPTALLQEIEMKGRQQNTGPLTIAEFREFSSFSAREQRYIRRSLDLGLKRTNFDEVLDHWSRAPDETKSIHAQARIYAELETLRDKIPEDSDSEVNPKFMTSLMSVTAFDLQQDHLECFSSYRFLYERLLGALVRPWLPSAFCAAAALPQLKPDKRKVLLQSISEAAATAPGWSTYAPFFFPEWVDKVEAFT
jgi:hypothetical protein